MHGRCAIIGAMKITSEVDRVLELQEWIRTGHARALRIERGISQGMAGREIGVDAAAIGRWEKSRNTPRGRNALEYHKFLSRLARSGD